MNAPALAEFLRARIIDERSRIRLAVCDYCRMPLIYAPGSKHAEKYADSESLTRMLANLEAQWRIVEDAKEHETCGGGYDECSEAALLTLRHLAAVYADHPDYDEEWRP